MTNVAKFYQDVIEDVIKEIKTELDYEGVDSQFLDELKSIWKTKLVEANVTGPDPMPHSSSQYQGLLHGANVNARQSYTNMVPSRQNASMPIKPQIIQKQPTNSMIRPTAMQSRPSAIQVPPNQQRPIILAQANNQLARPAIVSGNSGVGVPQIHQQPHIVTNSGSLGGVNALNHQITTQQHPIASSASFNQSGVVPATTAAGQISTGIGGQNLQLLRIGQQTFLVPQSVYVNPAQQSGQMAQQQHVVTSATNMQSQQMMPNMINDRFTKSQVDGKDSDMEDMDSDVDLMSEAPSSVRGPLSNMAPPTPLHAPSSSQATPRKHTARHSSQSAISSTPGSGGPPDTGRSAHDASSSDESDAGDFVATTPLGVNTPRLSGKLLHGDRSGMTPGGQTPMTPMHSIGETPKHYQDSHPSGGRTKRQQSGSGNNSSGKKRQQRNLNDFNYANSDSDYDEYENFDDSGMTPDASRKSGNKEKDEMPLNLIKVEGGDQEEAAGGSGAQVKKEESVEVDCEGVPLKPQAVRKRKKQSAAAAKEAAKKKDDLDAKIAKRAAEFGVDVDDEDDDDDDEVEEEEELKSDEQLNSGDDVNEEHPDELFKTDNVVVCQYDKVHRVRNKWRFYLKDGIMSIRGRDHLFQKAIGEAEW